MTRFLSALSLATAGLWAQAQSPVTITPAEREFLIDHLQKSRVEFFQSIEGLTPAQWNYRPASGGWTIAECAEHLTLTEDALFDMVTKKVMAQPVKADVVRKTRADDDKVLGFILDRSQKAKAPEMLIPSGKFPDSATIKTAFSPKRDRAIDYVRGVQDDLRGRSQGRMDAYQYLVMMSGHTLRHTAQLNEVKLDANYPK